jgi:hypothetical protein
MRNLLRSIFAAGFAALLVSSVSVSSDAIARGAYDGNWSVVIHTVRGDCGASLRYAVRIVDNHVQSGDQGYQAAGRVAPNGDIHVVVAEGGQSASGSGRLAGNVGRGLWRTSTGQCSGNWTAERRDY